MTQNDPVEQPADQPSDPPAAITSRFLFVDVAAQRAKQLRRGASPRIERSTSPHKLERVAMEEVRQRLIDYTLPSAADVLAGRQ